MGRNGGGRWDVDIIPAALIAPAMDAFLGGEALILVVFLSVFLVVVVFGIVGVVIFFLQGAR